MSILFTGHKGFLGRELIPALSMLDEIVVFDGDLLDFEAVRIFAEKCSVTKIFHAAARGGRRNKVETPSTLQNNVQVTTNILRLDLPTLLICSGAVYNREKSIDVATERKSLDSFPTDFYGQSKFITTALARNRDDCRILRFFNVFGITEGIDRFITFNISQYIKHEPMLIFSDFEMDFFFVEDALPAVNSWMAGDAIPNEMNMVYRSKFLLSEICTIINTLADYSVPIIRERDEKGKNYTGDGQLLESLGFPQLGLEGGILNMYHLLLNADGRD